MAKTILEKIADIEEAVRQLENQRKQLVQQHKEQERKERTHRLCKRGGLLESLVPGTVKLTDEQFKNFLERTISSEYARKILSGLLAQPVENNVSESTKPTQHGGVENVGTGATTQE